MENVKVLVRLRLPGQINKEKSFQKDKERPVYYRATQVIRLSQSTYEFMISDESKPSGLHLSNRLKQVSKAWNKLDKKRRLEFHIGELAGKSSFEYEVLD